MDPPQSSRSQAELMRVAQQTGFKYVVSAGRDSMKPVIGPPGSVLLLEDTPRSKIQIGDIVRGTLLIDDQPHIIVHRVIATDPIRTKGINNPRPDPVPIDQVYDRVVGVLWPNR